jgi:hypothetical protein
MGVVYMLYFFSKKYCTFRRWQVFCNKGFVPPRKEEGLGIDGCGGEFRAEALLDCLDGRREFETGAYYVEGG